MEKKTKEIPDLAKVFDAGRSLLEVAQFVVENHDNPEHSKDCKALTAALSASLMMLKPAVDAAATMVVADMKASQPAMAVKEDGVKS